MNWTDFRNFEGRILEVDYHIGSADLPDDMGQQHYWYKVGAWHELSWQTLEKAQREGYDWVLFRHGHSTSRPGSTTARSVVRGILRDKASTPYILRSRSYQKSSVYMAKVRPAQAPETEESAE